LPGPGQRRSARGDNEIAEREVTVLLADFATVWNELFPAEQARIVQLLVERVDVQEDALEVRIRAEGLASLVGELRQHGERMAAWVRAPRQGWMGTRWSCGSPCAFNSGVVVSASWRRTGASLRPRRSRNLMARWSRRSPARGGGRMLDEGAYTSVSEIGDAENISKSYVSRILRLALLAPDLVEAILARTTDQALMLEQLERPCRLGACLRIEIWLDNKVLW